MYHTTLMQISGMCPTPPWYTFGPKCITLPLYIFQRMYHWHTFGQTCVDTLPWNTFMQRHLTLWCTFWQKCIIYKFRPQNISQINTLIHIWATMYQPHYRSSVQLLPSCCASAASLPCKSGRWPERLQQQWLELAIDVAISSVRVLVLAPPSLLALPLSASPSSVDSTPELELSFASGDA